MYNSIFHLIHPASDDNTLLGILIGKFPLCHRSRLTPIGGPYFIFVRLLSFDVLEKALVVQTRVISAWEVDFMIKYTIRPSTVDSKLARDA